ncbi:hypothetical protein [Beijerinckia mobilis]|uniref:hypothetical protein n=1 Tax=Beijerinckia mobilis TaxID=231434 RepID=UPI0012EBA1CC|nr:hypothetical protein [Beijerinckia mobilis]
MSQVPMAEAVPRQMRAFPMLCFSGDARKPDLHSTGRSWMRESRPVLFRQAGSDFGPHGGTSPSALNVNEAWEKRQSPIDAAPDNLCNAANRQQYLCHKLIPARVYGWIDSTERVFEERFFVKLNRFMSKCSNKFRLVTKNLVFCEAAWNKLRYS